MTAKTLKIKPKDLRDEFAIEAMREIIRLNKWVHDNRMPPDAINETARCAYAYADAMIAERRKADEKAEREREEG